MLFMVIEHFRNNDPQPVRERFTHSGRMMPEGVHYHASWIDAERARCFQLMEADAAAALAPWIAAWSDIVEFDVVPVVTSAEFWAAASSFAQRPSPDEQELRAIEQGLARAWLDRDRGFLERVLASDWTVTQPDGTILDAIHPGADTHEWATDPRIRAVHDGLLPDVPLDGLTPPLGIASSASEAPSSGAPADGVAPSPLVALPTGGVVAVPSVLVAVVAAGSVAVVGAVGSVVIAEDSSPSDPHAVRPSAHAASTRAAARPAPIAATGRATAMRSIRASMSGLGGAAR